MSANRAPSTFIPTTATSFSLPVIARFTVVQWRHSRNASTREQLKPNRRIASIRFFVIVPSLDDESINIQAELQNPWICNQPFQVYCRHIINIILIGFMLTPCPSLYKKKLLPCPRWPVYFYAKISSYFFVNTHTHTHTPAKNIYRARCLLLLITSEKLRLDEHGWYGRN